MRGPGYPGPWGCVPRPITLLAMSARAGTARSGNQLDELVDGAPALVAHLDAQVVDVHGDEAVERLGVEAAAQTGREAQRLLSIRQAGLDRLAEGVRRGGDGLRREVAARGDDSEWERQ